MAGYDPKRPRPADASDDPAPVDALLGDDPTGDAADEHGTPDQPIAPVLDINGSTRPSPEVPVAPAPEEGTVNRAVLLGAAAAVVAAIVALVVLRRRSTRRAD